MDLTHGHLLGGRVRYAQPAAGYRSGIEPVLLAAAVPARAGARVLEGGSGAGAALLCLAARVPDLSAVGVERDPALASLAAENATANGATGLRFVAAGLETAACSGPFDHAMANPPYHPANGTVSPHPGRAVAKRTTPGMLAAWIRVLALHLRRRGTLTLIVPTARVPDCLAALDAARCASAAILPLWPKVDRAAKLVLLLGVKEGRSPLRLLPGLVLHQANGAFTPRAESILRHGAALDWS